MKGSLFSAVLVVFISPAIAITTNNSTNGSTWSRLAGGSETSYGEFPFQVSIQDGSSYYYIHFCGGVIYKENYVITSGRCAEMISESVDPSLYIRVVGGEHTLYTAEGNEQAISVTQVIIHEDYNQYAHSNDIALLKLSAAFIFNSYVNSITLPAKGEESNGVCTAIGWGQTVEAGQASSVLRKVSLPTVSDEDCRISYNGENTIEDSMMCAGSEGHGICEGDFGGPLICQNSKGTYLAGISSWVYGCGKSGFPSVFAEVSHYKDWIATNAK